MNMATLMKDFDVLIVGSGLAGLSAALHLAPTHRVAVLTKRSMNDGSSGWAQGGIAAVLGEGDSFESHVDDTLVAGAGLSDLEATRFVVEHAPESIAWLRQLGVPFSQEDGQLHLTREGGHSARRIVHVTDATGAAVQRTLIETVRRTPNIEVFEQHTLVDLITSRKLGRPASPNTCLGLYALDEATDEVVTFRAPQTILATGGAGKVYLYTTNPDTATGDGIAAAWRAGCRVTNMEFIQFHPTCLYHPLVKSFLITEAVRGEGGKLLLPDGTRFMPAHDPRAELAPRDVVARAIDFEMKKHGLDCVYLDISHQPPEFVREHFPNIHARCLELGIDITREPIPVVPAAHYTCGGIHTDLAGRTDVTGSARHRRDRLHRPARRQPAGQQLAGGVHGVRPRRGERHQGNTAARAAGRAVLGREPRDRCRRVRGDLAQLGRAAPLHVGLRGHRAYQQAPGACVAPHPAAAGRDPGVLRELPHHARPAGAAQPGHRGRPDRQVGAGAAREPRAALQPRLPANGGRRPSDHADSE